MRIINIDVSELSKEETEEIISKIKDSFEKIDPVIEEIKPTNGKNFSLVLLGVIFLGWLIYMIWFNKGGLF